MQKEDSIMDKKSLFYEDIAEKFDNVMDMYDTNKRLRIIFNEFLKDIELKNKKLLDVGSGTGWFSKSAYERGAKVFSVDVGENLLMQVRKKCPSIVSVSDACNLAFADNTFDFVICTECIEHTPNPQKAFSELTRVLKKNGILIVTVPNRIWHFSVAIANKLKIRPYEGYENWVSWRKIEEWSGNNGIKIVKKKGFNLFPFFFKILHPVIDFFDTMGEGSLRYVMINISIVGTKIKE